MPEYPDITVYVERLRAFLSSVVLRRIRFASPFLLRTAEPPIESIYGKTVVGIEPIGKRIVFSFEEELYLVLHLMVSGRLLWEEASAKIPAKRGLAAMDFESGTLLVTEASTKKRASLHLVEGADSLAEFDRGGAEVFEIGPDRFIEILRSENHTLKRSLTDPRMFSGIGNAYSDEILHRAGLSPMMLSSKIGDEDARTLYESARTVLEEWTDRLRGEVGDGFPRKVTAFRKEMAVHGKYGQACPVCGNTVQRIRYADNETNYCPQCQNGGRLLADRSLSRLLKDDWPRTPEELEEIKQNPQRKANR